jgi:hypothetical protein
MYQRGGRSQAGRGRMHGFIQFKKASPCQIYEHGQWQLRRSSQTINIQYDQWTYADCISISLFSL